MHLTLYTTVGCIRCAKVRKLLKEEGLPFREVSIDTFPQTDDQLYRMTNGQQPPLLFYSTRPLGDYEQLLETVKEGRLRELVMAEGEEREDETSLASTDQNGNESEESSQYSLYRNGSSFDSCEGEPSAVPDELIRVLDDMRKANFIRDNRVGLVRVYRTSFKGADLVEWLMRTRDMTRKEALELGQEIIDRHLGQQSSKEIGDTFSPDRYYQLIEDDENKPLNTGDVPDEHLTVAELNEQIVRIIQPIYDEICSKIQKTVHYYKLVENENFVRYLLKCRQLQKVNLSESTTDERLALFVNVYNMLVIHMTQKYGPALSVWQRRRYIFSTYYTIDGHNYALQSMLNGILRANRRGRDMLWKPFGKHDQRAPLQLAECEPLVHFALSLADRGAPPLRAYSVNGVREQLREQARNLIGKDEYVKIEPKKGIVYLSKIFKWYAEDFGGSNGKILEWILDIMDGDADEEKRNQLQRMYYTGEYKIDYLHYDQGFNGVERNERPTLPSIDCRIRAASEVLDSSYYCVPTPTS